MLACLVGWGTKTGQGANRTLVSFFVAVSNDNTRVFQKKKGLLKRPHSLIQHLKVPCDVNLVGKLSVSELEVRYMEVISTFLVAYP